MKLCQMLTLHMPLPENENLEHKLVSKYFFCNKRKCEVVPDVNLRGFFFGLLSYSPIGKRSGTSLFFVIALIKLVALRY